ncbi:MAG TPA: hypothetical protein ENH52_00430 [Nitrospirae bacterium]|nr:hypothetical protein [Nitrospirota bacterium]
MQKNKTVILVIAVLISVGLVIFSWKYDQSTATGFDYNSFDCGTRGGFFITLSKEPAPNQWYKNRLKCTGIKSNLNNNSTSVFTGIILPVSILIGAFWFTQKK